LPAVSETKRIKAPLNTAPTLLGALLSAVLIAGCGASESSKITVGQENPNAAAEAAKEEAAASASGTTSAATASASTVKTPTSGPLSVEPKVTPPPGPAPTTLVTKELIKGTGPTAVAGDTVTVNYVGVLYHGGKVFDASWKRHEPFSFALGKGQVIPGWDQGVAGMKVGGRRELIIPSSLAYGTRGSPPVIPPNAPLVFVVDLLGV
jgi:peptidylprolyl isomerase